MRASLPLLLSLGCALPLQAQGVRLLDRIEAPLLYLALDPAKPGADPSGEAAANAQPAAVQQLLANPALDLLFASTANPGAAKPSSAVDSGSRGSSHGMSRALTLVRGVLTRSSGELELALTSVVPSGGQPLLVFRARLLPSEAQRLQETLAGAELALPHRRIDGRQTWAMRSAEPARRPGELVEIGLHGADLLVSNDAMAMEELLAPMAVQTSAGAARRVLANDPRFTGLRRRLPLPAGSLLVYGDWQRLGQRLQAASSDLPGFLLDWSGLGSAQGVMASLAVAPGSGNFSCCMLFDFAGDADSAGEKGRPTDRQRGTSAEVSPIDGWLAAATPVAARSLAAELPPTGFGGLVLAVDLADIARRSPHGHELLHELRRAFHRFGLDFERNVLGRLGSRGTVQLLFRQEGAASTPEIVAVYAVRAKSRKAAGDLFADLRRASEQAGRGRLLSGRDGRSSEVLELRSAERADATYVGLHDDQVFVAFDADTVSRVVDDLRRAGRQRLRRDGAIANAVASSGADQVVGLFDADLGPWLERLAAALAASDGMATGDPAFVTGDAGRRLDLSQLPKRHLGYLGLEPREHGVVLRVTVLSSQ